MNTHWRERPEHKRRLSLRQKLFKMEKGICQHCGLDCAAIDKKHRAIYRLSIVKASEFMRQIGLHSFSSRHMDHIIPIDDGGANCIWNLQTLCQWCHVIKTRKDRTRSTIDGPRFADHTPQEAQERRNHIALCHSLIGA